MWGWLLKLGKSSLGAIRGLFRWLTGKVVRRIAWEIGLWLGGVGIAWAIKELEQEIAAAIRRGNEGLLIRLFRFQDWVFRWISALQNNLTNAVDLAEGAALDAVFLPTNKLLEITGIKGRIEDLFSWLLRAAANLVRKAVSFVMSPITKQAHDRWRNARADCDQLKAFRASASCADTDIDAINEAISSQEAQEAALLEIYQSLLQVPENITNRFINNFPTVIKERLEKMIIDMLTDAIDKGTHNFQTKVKDAFESMKQKIDDKFGAVKNRFVKETNKLRDAVYDAEKELVNKLPKIIRPTFEKQIERIKNQIVRTEKEILVNLDQIQIDMSVADNIVEKIKKYRHDDAPIKFRAKEWTISDVYRLLNYYFYRQERIALALLLMDQDLQMEAARVGDALMKVN